MLVSRLGNLLVKKGVVTRDVLDQALKIQNENPSANKQLDEILVENLGLDHHKVYGALAELYAFRSINIKLEKIEPTQIKHTKELLEKFPQELKRELLQKKILPYQLAGGQQNTLIVLAANVMEKTTEKISQATEFKQIETVYCPYHVLEELIRIIDPQKNEFLDLLLEASEQGSMLIGEPIEEKEINESALDEEINKSLLVNLFEGCLVEAVRKGASDVHIIPYRKSSVDFHFRVDGRLTLWHRLDNTSPEAVSTVVKDRSVGIDRFERDTSQDGFMQRTIDGHLIRFRVSLVPIISSEFERRFESVVIRVIDDRNVITDFRKLGFQDQAEKDFLKAVSKSKGLILLTGPTGSGKSTTLMAALHQVIDPSRNVLTCEDPVEYVIEGARQIKIGHKLSFEDAIRSILRHDPDIVMVGEIRDKITADVSVKLSNTGHLTFSTLHTNDAPSAISRLFKMGIEPFILANVINIIIAQRLVRKVCPVCRVPLPKEEWQVGLEAGLTKEDLESGMIFKAGEGCKKCTNGYKGRINICEALYFTPEIRKAVVESGVEIDEEKILGIARSQGMLTLHESGLDRIRNGLTTLSEVLYATSGEF